MSLHHHATHVDADPTIDREPLVLIVEDEPHIRQFLRASLGPARYRVIEAATAADGLEQARSRAPDIIRLDLGLPDGDGVDVTRTLRRTMTVPIIVLLARDRESDKVAALDAGADDFLGKPIGVAELLARLRVARRYIAAMAQSSDSVQRFGDIRFDPDRREVHRGDEAIHLTPCEYKLFAALAHAGGRVVSHRQLLVDVWGPGAAPMHHLRVYMTQLRRKLEANPTRPRWLVTEVGVGYRLRNE